MKKMRRSLGVLTAAVLLLAFAGQSSAFCVYNNTTDKELIFRQTSGGKHSKSYASDWLKPGESGCCHWQNKDCNKAGKKDSPVEFKVYYYRGDLAHDITVICKDFQITAGGALTVEGSGGNYRCVAHGY